MHPCLPACTAAVSIVVIGPQVSSRSMPCRLVADQAAIIVLLFAAYPLRLVCNVVLNKSLESKCETAPTLFSDHAGVRAGCVWPARLWVHDDAPNSLAFQQLVLRLASRAPAQYVQLMNQSGKGVSYMDCTECGQQHAHAGGVTLTQYQPSRQPENCVEFGSRCSEGVMTDVEAHKAPQSRRGQVSPVKLFAKQLIWAVIGAGITSARP